MAEPAVDAVVIGRNEGARLAACLDSLAGDVARVVYVDSGSTDDSVALARARGAQVVELDLSQPFTAARARNAGLAALGEHAAPLVQFVDGDCTVQPGWIDHARAFLAATPGAAVACGRRREARPEVSVYNRLCDREWDTPVGEARACGGDAMMRRAALEAVGGYRDGLIAGEEPELCLRLRRAGWSVWRLDAPMTRHDARITRFGQWWTRARRAGYAFAAGSALHGRGPEQHWVAETRRALAWGLVLPLAVLAAALAWPPALLAGLVYPAQVARLALRAKGPPRDALAEGLFTMLGKFAEAQGVLRFHRDWLRGRPSGLIEYK